MTDPKNAKRKPALRNTETDTADLNRPRGRRKGRPLRVGRARLVEERLPELKIKLPSVSGCLKPETLFSPPVAKVWLEIGFGGGEHLAAQASANPDVGFLGCEFFSNGVASLLRYIEEQRLENIRLHNDDARTLIATLSNASIDRIFLLHPDPWPKKRHAARRFISQTNLDALARILPDNGLLRVATDHPVYLEWTLQQMKQRTDFEWLARKAQDWTQRPDDWPATRYGKKAVEAGRRCTYLTYQRRVR